MIILDGKKSARRILRRLKAKIKRRRLKLKMAVIQVGGNAVSDVYLTQKQKACSSAGLCFELFRFSGKISEEELAKEIKRLNADPAVSGIVVQLPLPKHIKTPAILNLIALKKDADCLSEAALGKFYNNNALILPPVVSAVASYFNEYKIKIKAKNAAIVGAGRLVGKPLAVWLVNQKATVSIVNEFTPDISVFTKKADILISGVGKPNLITGKMIKKGAIVIDAGSSAEHGRPAGDVNFKSVSKRASYLTPVPGGIGPLAVACLLENLVKLNLENVNQKRNTF